MAMSAIKNNGRIDIRIVEYGTHSPTFPLAHLRHGIIQMGDQFYSFLEIELGLLVS